MEKKHHAQQLYMAGGRTQKEIAETIGVSERTVYTWVHQFSWDKLRLAALQAPATIADNICAQIVELQNGIARREPGMRFPTMEEAEISRKLIASLEKMKKYPSTSQHMQVLETFRNYIRPVDKEFAKQFAGYTTRFLSAKNVNGYAPYQLEYGVSPIDPYYNEPEETGSDTADMPCKNIDNCRHEGSCNYPRCTFLQNYGEPADPLVTYNIPAFHFPQPEMQHLDTLDNDIPLPEETGSIPADMPCTNINNCRHEGNCNYPSCLHLHNYNEPADPLTTYSIPAFHFPQPEMQYFDTPDNDRPLPEETGSIPADMPCTDIDNCRNEKGCNYPQCLHEYDKPESPLTTYNIPAFNFPQPEMQYVDKPGNDIPLGTMTK